MIPLEEKIKLLKRFGYKENERLKTFQKIHTFHGLEVWESYISFRFVAENCELDVFRKIKWNEHHAKDFIKTHYGF